MVRAEHVRCYTGNYDGIRQGLVIAGSQKKAAEIARCSLYSFRQYWSKSDWPNMKKQRLKIYTLYTKPINCRKNEDVWFEGRCTA